MTGYTMEDVAGKTPRVLQGPGTDRTARQEIRESLERWRPVRVELINYHKDGTEFWVELNIVPVANERGWFTHWVSVQRDITERQLEEEERRRSEERFRAALSEQASVIVIVLDEDGTIRYGSPSTKNLLGFTPGEIVGWNAFDYLHPEDKERVLEAFERVSNGTGARPVERRARHRDGSWRYLEAIGSDMVDDPSVRGIVVNSWDITGRIRVEGELRLKDRAIAASSNGIIITDLNLPDNPIIYVNPRFEQITGYPIEEAVGQNCRFIANGDRDQPGVYELRLALQERREWSGSLRNYRKDGTVFWNELYIAPVRGEDGRITNFIGIQKDITERKVLEQQLVHQAYHDPLTNLPNRTLLLERLGRVLERARRRGHEVAVLFMDLDNFKVLNDSLGHEAGDQLLVEVAGRISTRMRPGDTVARLGGDEFVVLLEEVEDAGEARRAAERVSEALSEPFYIEGRELFITTSVGLALGGTNDYGPGELVRNADLAMYRAKGAGKNSCAVFEFDMDERAQERLKLEEDLRRALKRGELRVYYQPEVSLESGRIVGEEALVRWEHPERGLLGPHEFIPLAEGTGLIFELGRWVLREACRQTKEWQERYPDLDTRSLVVSVNLSAKQLERPDLVWNVAQILEETGLEPRYLVMEITESMVMQDVDAAIQTLTDLKTLGVRIAVDDFGTGYSSLSYLKRFPVDNLKIDRSFINELGDDPNDTVLMSGVISLARALGLGVIVEGVETAEQLRHLRDLGCELAQGSFSASPSPVRGPRSYWRPAGLASLPYTVPPPENTDRNQHGSSVAPALEHGVFTELVHMRSCLRSIVSDHFGQGGLRRRMLV